MNDAEKRKFKRFPVLYHLIKPVLIRTQDSKAGISSPAIMANLSAGGMALLTFSPLPVGKNILISFDLKDLKIDNVKSRVVRCENKEGSYIIGIQFINMPNDIAKKINKMADDFDSCETRILLGEKPVCKKGCDYFEHCQRVAKGHY
ncbi:MAG: PilZ domain-containing protein [Elusimicrobiota bacterium]